MDALSAVLLSGDAEDTVRFRVALVTSSSPLEITMGGQGGLSASRCAAYSPSFGDRVLVLQSNTDLVIIDRLISGG